MFLRGFALLFVMAQLLLGRENPFAPAQDYKGIDAPTNIIVERGDFEQQALSLPSNARVLKYVLFGYQTLNGDTEEMRMEVDKNIDWHDPIVVTKESILINPPFMSPPAFVEINNDEDQAPATSLEEEKTHKKIKSNEVAIEVKDVIASTQASNMDKKPSVTVGFEDLIGFEAFSRRIIIMSSDKLIRHFMIADPYKVVLDFEKQSAFYTQYLPLNHGAFKQITLGNHSGYYRAAITLDGHYIYEIKPIEGGYEVVLK